MPSSSAPAGASGVPSNNIPRAQAYQPFAQQGVDQGLVNIMQQFPQNPTSTPAGTVYPQALNLSSGFADPNNPYFNEAIGGAQVAANQFAPFGQFANNTFDALGAYQPTIAPTMANAEQIAQYAPQVGSEAAGLLNFTGTNATNLQNFAQGGGADLVAQLQRMASGGAGNLYGGAGTALDYGTNAAATMAPLVQGGAANLANYGGQILNTAFDPQSALFSQLENQVRQQANASNAAAGLGGSAYGAGNTSNALSNFDINWENQQLGRQATGLGAAGTAYGQIPGLLNAPTAAYGTGLNLAGQAYGQIPGLLASPMSLATSTAAAPLSVLSSGLQGTNLALGGAANLNASPGASLNSLLSPLFSGSQGAGNILSSGASFSGLPFQQQGSGVNSMLGALQGGVTIGNNQYTIPQQLINDAQSYLGLGQAASSLSGQLGQLGQNQLFNSLSGIGGAANLGSQLLTGNSLGNLFGSGGLLGSLGIGGGSDLAGSSGLAAGLSFPASSLGGGFGFDAAGSALAGATDFGGGADFLGSLLPLAFA